VHFWSANDDLNRGILGTESLKVDSFSDGHLVVRPVRVTILMTSSNREKQLKL